MIIVKAFRIKMLMTAALVLATTRAGAGLEDQFDTMFDGMINVTPAGAYMGQRRGVLTGGSVEARIRVMRPNLVSFVPPSADAGCGGVSLFGGSFSFINSAQLTQLLRAIAQNAAGYAFGLAIDAMCPTCAGEMKALQKRMQELNQMMSDSCQTAMTLVDKSGFRGTMEELKEKNKGKLVKEGAVDGWFDTLPFFSGKDETVKAAEELTPAQREEVEENIVYQSIKKHNVATWYTNGGDANLEHALMALTGTVIARFEPQGAAPAANMEIRQLDPKINIKDFINGTESGKAGYWKCPDALIDPKCIWPTEVLPSDPDALDLTGVRSRVESMLFGDGVGAGILTKFSMNIGDLSVAEKQFLEAIPYPVLGMIRNTSKEPGLSELLAREFVNMISITLAMDLVNEMVKSVSLATQTNAQYTMTEVWNKNMAELRKQMHEERVVLMQQDSQMKNVFELFTLVRNGLHDRPATFMKEQSQRTLDDSPNP